MILRILFWPKLIVAVGKTNYFALAEWTCVCGITYLLSLNFDKPFAWIDNWELFAKFMMAITDNSHIADIFGFFWDALVWAAIKQKFFEYIDRTLKRPRGKAYILQKWQGFALTEKKSWVHFAIRLLAYKWATPGSILVQHFRGCLSWKAKNGWETALRWPLFCCASELDNC